MPDKLTDSEIVKALELCLKNECDKCPFNLSEVCQIDLMKLLFDLINRQKAENEVLRNCVEQNHITRKDGKSPLSLFTEEIKTEAYKEFAEELEKRFALYCGMKIDFTNASKMLDNLLKELVGEKK